MKRDYVFEMFDIEKKMQGLKDTKWGIQLVIKRNQEWISEWYNDVWTSFIESNNGTFSN